MHRERFLEIFNKLPNKRKEVLLGLLRGDTREKIMANAEVNEAALTQHKRQLYKSFKIELFQNEADDLRSGERKLPLLVALCAKYKPELISLNTDPDSPARPQSFLCEELIAHAGNPLTDLQRMILRESLAGKGYEDMEGYTPQHIKNEDKKLWDLLSKAFR